MNEFKPAIWCPDCGRVELTLQEYEDQLLAAHRPWVCHCGRKAEFDDSCLDFDEDPV